MARISRIDSYQVKSGESYFFDNNVWMLLFSSIANSKAQSQRRYSNLLREIQSRNGTIFISSLILSEFINSNLRLSFNLWRKRTGNIMAEYKRDFRPTQEYRDELKAIESNVQEILKKTERIPDDFNSINIDDILKNMENSDYNDEYYIRLCESRKLKLVTGDSDILNTAHNIEIITE